MVGLDGWSTRVGRAFRGERQKGRLSTRVGCELDGGGRRDQRRRRRQDTALALAARARYDPARGTDRLGRQWRWRAGVVMACAGGDCARRARKRREGQEREIGVQFEQRTRTISSAAAAESNATSRAPAREATTGRAVALLARRDSILFVFWGGGRDQSWRLAIRAWIGFVSELCTICGC